MSYFGKVRLFVRKLEKASTWSSGFETGDESQHFDDCLISDVSETSSAEVLTEEIHASGYDLFDDSVQTVLESYQLYDVVEILADAHIEYSKSWTDWGYEYDAEGWFENVKHRKLSPMQVKRFAADLLEEGEEPEGAETPEKEKNDLLEDYEK